MILYVNNKRACLMSNSNVTFHYHTVSSSVLWLMMKTTHCCSWWRNWNKQPWRNSIQYLYATHPYFMTTFYHSIWSGIMGRNSLPWETTITNICIYTFMRLCWWCSLNHIHC